MSTPINPVTGRQMAPRGADEWRAGMREMEARFESPSGQVDLLAMSRQLPADAFRLYILISREWRRAKRPEVEQK